jgi:hypothetical protein
MIQTLNLILLTSSELSEARSALKSLKQSSSTQQQQQQQISNQQQQAKHLFTTLYKSWSHNPTGSFVE